MVPNLKWLIVSAAVALLPLSVLAAPMGYAINSDAFENSDHLLRINLANGLTEDLGPLDQRFADTEGLAFDAEGTLYAVDDNTDTLITINPENGVANPVGNVLANLGFSTPSGDYGLSFTCSGQLILTSDQTNQAYYLNLSSGRAAEQSTNLNVGLTGLAAYGDNLYGVGAEGNENLYKINLETGQANLLGALGTPLFEDAGLAFDTDGTLWMITDGTIYNTKLAYEPSKIYTVNLETGQATYVAETAGGIESLAIAPPACNVSGFPAPVPATTPLSLLLLILSVSALSYFILRNKSQLSH